MAAITTHVLDTSRGRPAVGVPIVLERHSDAGLWEAVGHGDTDSDGRLRSLISPDAAMTPGLYRLVFDVARYFAAHHVRAFYPTVVIVFETTQGESHYHVPLLLSPYGYSTYRGS